jgi:hypothetical protein
VHIGVADQALHGGAVEDRAVEQPAVPLTLEVVEGGDDVEVGPVASAAVAVLVVEEPPAHIDQGVGAPLRGAAAGFAGGVAAGGEAQGGVDDGAAFGIEAAGEFAAPVEDAGQVQ